MARILISWGFCSAAVGLVGTSPTIDAVLTRPINSIWLAFMLGLAEAGFYPGIIVYLTHWFSLPDRARAMSGLILGIPIALGLGAAISAAILQVHWFGYSGWRWLFILEGLPAVALGLFTLFYLTDRPKHAHWLESRRARLDRQHARERAARQARHRTHHDLAVLSPAQRDSAGVGVVLRQSEQLHIRLLAAERHRQACVRPLGNRLTLYSGLPYALAILATIVVSYLSDRSGRRRFYAIVPMVVTGLALMLSAIPDQPFWMLMVWLCLAGAGIYAGSPSFWVLSTVTLQASAAAASIGMINAIANFSGYVAPPIVGKMLDHGWSHNQIVPLVACGPLVGAVLVALLRIPRPSELQAEKIKELGPASNLEVE